MWKVVLWDGRSSCFEIKSDAYLWAMQELLLRGYEGDVLTLLKYGKVSGKVEIKFGS